MSPVQIGLLHYTYPPAIGGVERIMQGQAGMLAAAGHTVTVYTGWRGDGPTPEVPGVRVHVLPELRRGTPSADPAEFAAEAHRLADSLEPRLAGEQVVFLHNVCTMPFHPALTAALWELAGKLRQVRFLAWVHDLAAGNPDYHLPPEPTEVWSRLRRACPALEYVAVSPLRQRQVAEVLGVDPARCRVIPNGIEPAEHWGLPPGLNALVQRWRLLERAPVLLHPARLVRRKNVEGSLAILHALRQQGHDAVLLLTGAHDPHQPASEEYRQELLQYRRELGLENAAFFLADHLPAAEMSSVDGLYRLAEAVLFPSRQEGFGLPVLEAALHRVPIFAPAREPLTGLAQAGVCFYPPEASSTEVAAQIMHHLEASAAIQARREVLRHYAWPTLYQKIYAPLLAGGAPTYTP